MIDEKILKQDEKAVFALRSLYRKYGYLPFKMSKFEEYELYMKNKDFLVSDRIISFNDTTGRLMALKPDVTLSIIKNGDDTDGVKQKVCYSENVYRVSETTHRFKEIMQSGLECIGDIDSYDIFEVILLAAKSLALISDSYVLEVSHLGVLSDTLEKVCPDESFREKALAFIAAKNGHDLSRLCADRGLAQDKTDLLMVFVSAYGERRKVLKVLGDTLGDEAVSQMRALSEMLDRTDVGEHIRFDFSVVNDLTYYNGFVFKGFLDGICDGVLAGGQYDKLMQRMGRKSGAIGFAVYLDLLEQLREEKRGYDVNVLLVYDEMVSPSLVAEKIEELTESGLTVSAQKAIPEKLRYREMLDLRKEAR